MRKNLVLFLVLGAFVVRPCFAGDVWEDLMPGVRHLHRTTVSPTWDIHVVIIDLTNPRVDLRVGIKNDHSKPDAGETVRSLCQRYNAVVGILAALLHRDRTGEGQYIDISMTDGSIAWTTYMATRYFVGGKDPDYESDFLNGGSYYDCYRTLDGRYMSVGSLEPQFYEEMCRGIGREDLIPKRGWGMEADETMKEVKKEIAAVFATKTQAEWVERFRNFDACVEPVLTLSEMVDHPQTRARNMVTGVPKPDGTVQKQINSPFKFSRTPPEMRRTGPALGEHTEEVLREAGYGEAEIEALRQKQVFGRPPG